VIIGTIVKSNSHVSYLCRIYGKLETDDVPEPSDFAFGTFHAIPLGAGKRLICAVRDTVLVNPEYGNHGPRLSPDRDLAIFSPDYLNEKGVLVELVVLGDETHGRVNHGIPPLAPEIGARVEAVTDEDVLNFHRNDRRSFCIAYLSRLSARNDPALNALLLDVLDRLEPSFPEDQPLIRVLRDNLAWKSQIVPAG